MGEPLKSYFGPEVAAKIADMVEGVFPAFDRSAFFSLTLDGFEHLELTLRARQIAEALAETLPADRERAIRILTRSLGPEIEGSELTGMDSFLYMPMVMFVASEGLGCYEASMLAQYELTKRFTAEFSIRAFLEACPERTLLQLAEWARDPNVHVRRLVSEGTRPRLPWAGRLRAFQEDPTPVLELLELLKDDPEEYVRRSVANNLNDISKDHPDRVIQVATRWAEDATENRRRLLRHGLRTLVKACHPDALEVLGYTAESPIEVVRVSCRPKRIEIGGKVQLEFELSNPSAEEAPGLIDFRVHFVKADGSSRPKVFKGAELRLKPEDSATIRKTVSLAQHTTRRHHPGKHLVELLVNGSVRPATTFEIC